MTHLKGKAFGDDGGEVDVFKVTKDGADTAPLWVASMTPTDRGASVMTQSGAFEVADGSYLVNYKHGVEVLNERQLKSRFKDVVPAKDVDEDDLREKRGAMPSLAYFDQVNVRQPQAIHGTRTANDIMRERNEIYIQEEAAQARKDLHAMGVEVEDVGSKAAQDRGVGRDDISERTGAQRQTSTGVDTSDNLPGGERNVENPANRRAQAEAAAAKNKTGQPPKQATAGAQ